MRRAFYPLIVASQTIPIIVIAPILVVWFGFGIGPKLAIVALICFFPITVNTLDGLRSVDPDATKMMRTLDASRWQTFRRVEAPTALPYVFSGAKIAVAVAVIGAVFGELVNPESGLGYLIFHDGYQYETARQFASVFVLSAMAIALFGLLALASAVWSLGDRKQGMKLRQTPLVAVAIALLALALGLAACGEKSENVTGQAQPFGLTLDFYPNPDHAGIYMAQKLGYFAKPGSTSRSTHPPTPRRRSSRSPPGAPTWRSPTSPRWCWPSSRASTWSRSGRWSTGRSPR